MGTGDLLSLLAIIVSICAAIFTFVQVRLAKRSNMLPILIDMLSEFRSNDFKLHQRYIQNDLKYTQNTGYRDLNEEEKNHVCIVSYFFDHLGTLVMEKMVNKEYVLKFMAKSVLDTWYILRPFVYAERDKYWKTSKYKYQYGFEYLAIVSKEYLDKIENSRIEQKFLPPEKY